MLISSGHNVEKYGYSFCKTILQAEIKKRKIAVLSMVEAVSLVMSGKDLEEYIND